MKSLFSFEGRISTYDFQKKSSTAVRIGIISFLVLLLDLFLAFPGTDFLKTLSSFLSKGSFPFIISLIIFFTLLASSFLIFLSAAARRFHDRDKSGWWSLSALLPFIGSVWFLTELNYSKGTDGPNKYGPDPLAPKDNSQLSM